MAEYSNIIAALDTKLKSFADLNGYFIAWPGRKFPSALDETNGYDDGPYFAVSFIPAQTGIGGLDADSYQIYNGIYQVDVRCKKGTGMVDMRNLTDALLTEFSKGSSQTNDGLKVSVLNSWASSMFDIDSLWFSTPVSISYQAFA